MQLSPRWTLALVACAAFGLGVLVTVALFLALGPWRGDASAGQSPSVPLAPATSSTISPSEASSAGPPPPAPIGGPSGTSMPTQANCSVRLEPVPDDEEAARLVVETSTDVDMLWGMISSGEKRTGGPIYLTAGRGEQIVPGFAAEQSEIVVYGDPSMTQESEACRSE